MTFQEAKSELEKLAKGEYRSITYSQTISDDKNIESVCEVYIHKYETSTGPTWKEALSRMKCQINGEEFKQVFEKGIPLEEG